MYCEKCGEKIKDGNKFCTKCGFELNSNEIEIKNNTKNDKNGSVNKADGKAVASLILGCISLLLSFSLTIIMFPLELVGLILGIVSKTKCSERTAGIIINAVSMVISIISFILLIILIIVIGIVSDKKEDNRVSFIEEDASYTWHCKLNEEANYSVELILNTDSGSYVWSKYDDAINNSVYGIYESTKIEENKYTFRFKSSSIISNSNFEVYEYVSNYEVIFDNNDNFQMNSLDNLSRYICDYQK